MGDYTLLAVLGLLVFSNLFWALVCHRLINKLMSRSFFEYKEAELQPEKLKVASKDNKIEVNENDFEDFGALSELTPMG